MHVVFSPCDINYFRVHKQVEYRTQVLQIFLTIKTPCSKRHATAYTVPVALLTFKVIQGQWFPSNLSGRMPLSTIIVINSNLGRIFHRFRDMDSSPLENARFSYPHPFNPQFENVSLRVDGWNFACQRLRPMTNYSCKKFFPMPESLATTHPLQTDRRIDRRTTTMPITRPLLTYGRLESTTEILQKRIQKLQVHNNAVTYEPASRLNNSDGPGESLRAEGKIQVGEVEFLLDAFERVRLNLAITDHVY